MRFLFSLLLMVSLHTQAQQKFYFVSFKDKPHYKEKMGDLQSFLSLRAIERRVKNRVPINVNDFPPESAYLEKLAQLPLVMYGNSRWFNGTVILSDSKNIVDSVKQLEFVSSITYLGPAYLYDESKGARESSLENQLNILEQTFENKKGVKDTLVVGKSYQQLKQINDYDLLLKGTAGKDVLIAVMDAGYQNLDQLAPFKHLIKEKRILAAYDYVDREEEVFEDDEHGLSVMSCMAAWQPGLIAGTAPKASYLLFRTENAATEFLVEEYFWALAAEFADSAGADIINCSLGYTRHDDKNMGHKYSELDGKTTLITRAVEIASTKGILVFVSAGNEGDDPWKQLCAPADAPHAITVGAIDRFGNYAGFSSVGPTADKRIKPDLTAMGKGTALISGDARVFEGNGTSYSCPILAGAAAQLIQLNNQASAEKIREVLILSGSQYYKPDKYEGSGIPDMQLAALMICARKDTLLDVRELGDNYLHICIYSRINQKVTISITEPIKGEVDKVTLNLKKGTNRMQLKGYKKRSAGLYQLSVQFPSGVVNYEYLKP